MKNFQDYLVTITLQEPVCIAAQKGVGNVIPTLDYIPGSSVRGALAELWLQAKGQKAGDGSFTFNTKAERAKFEEIFLADGARFGNCTKEQACIVPRTAASCKHNKGFGKQKHGVHNLLFAGAAAALTPSYQTLNQSCPVCGSLGALDSFTGYYLPESGAMRAVTVQKRFVARTRISEYFDTAHHGALYTREALEAGQSFSGKLRLPSQADGDFFGNLLAAQSHTVHFGAAKSRSTGRAKLELLIWQDDGEEPLPQRFDDVQKFFAATPGCFWPLTALSDLIVRDDFLRCKSWLDRDDVQKAAQQNLAKLGAPPGELERTRQVLATFKLVRGWTATHQVSGWQAAWRLPKFDDLAIAAGSVFLFYRPDPLEDAPSAGGKSERAIFLQAMQALEDWGLGERRSEGFGQLSICDHFHLGKEWS